MVCWPGGPGGGGDLRAAVEKRRNGGKSSSAEAPGAPGKELDWEELLGPSLDWVGVPGGLQAGAQMVLGAEWLLVLRCLHLGATFTGEDDSSHFLSWPRPLRRLTHRRVGLCVSLRPRRSASSHTSAFLQLLSGRGGGGDPSQLCSSRLHHQPSDCRGVVMSSAPPGGRR